MTPNGFETGEFTRSASDPAAESTHFHPKEVVDGSIVSPDATRSSDEFYPAGKSMRLSARSQRGSLAAKITLPIVLAMILGVIVMILLTRTRVTNVQMDDLKQEAADAAFTISMLGRTLFSLRDDFWRNNPNAVDASELPTGRHWLVQHKLVSEKDWIDATGFNLNEYAPIETLRIAREHLALKNFAGWLNTRSQMVAVYLLDADLKVFARAEADSFRFDSLALQTIPVPVESEKQDGITISVDYVDSIEPEPLFRGIARIYSHSNPDEQMGVAVVILRTAKHSNAMHSLLILLAFSGLAFIAVMGFVAWYSAGKVTGPIRRLAADMQAMAEGDYTRRSGLAGTDEIGMLAQAFNSMAERLRVARANEKENSRLESDLAIARSIQNNLLPLQTPRVRGLDIHTSYRPAKEIGGDYFDFLPVDSQHMGIVIADASGKSIPAALVMSTTRAILRFVAPGNNSAAEALTRVNAVLSVDIPKGMFVTAYYIILEPLNNQMLCASAGHTPLLIARADETVELMNPGGIALGFDNGPIFQRSIREQRVKLEKGDRVLLYTDGVVECVNPANEEYSDRRLREFLRRNRDLSSHDFIGALLADLDRHRGTADMRDDTTIVTFKVL